MVNSKSFFLKPYRLYTGSFMPSSLFEMITKQPKFWSKVSVHHGDNAVETLWSSWSQRHNGCKPLV